MSEPTKIFITQKQGDEKADAAKRARRNRAIASLLLIIVGTACIALAAGFMVGTFWASCGIIGVVVLIVGVLLGTSG